MLSARISILGLVLCVSACGGGGSGSGTTPPPVTPPPANPGTPANVDTSVNFTIGNVNSGLPLDIAAASQTAAAAAVQATAGPSPSK